MREKSQYREQLENLGLKIRYDSDTQSYTRLQKREDVLQKSYIDYFYYSGIKTNNFQIRNQIGNSDHYSIYIEI